MRLGDRLDIPSVEKLAYDPELALGARNAIETCLAVQPTERVTIVTDIATAEIAASLLAAIQAVGAHAEYYVLEQEGERPLAHFPETILRAIERSNVAIGCLRPQEGEIKSRSELIDLVERQQIRYAHMVHISPEIMRQSMRADYQAVDALSDRVLQQVRGARSVTVKSPAGTHIEANFQPGHLWFKTSGLVDRKYWSNLPGGEVWSVPDDVRGIFVADAAVGDYMCEKYGNLATTPLTLEIENGRLQDAHCSNNRLRVEFLEYCHKEVNGDRVGEFAFGTNIGISEMIGNLLQDEKVPGVHIAFGNPLPNLTSANWSCTSHIDAISRNTDVWADDVQIMQGGRFLI